MITYQIIQEITVGTESNLIFAQQLCDKLNEQQDGSTYRADCYASSHNCYIFTYFVIYFYIGFLFTGI